MKMKKILISLLLVTAFGAAIAAPVSEADARRAAENFWFASTLKPCQSATALPGTGFAQLRIFDIDGGSGFVIVASDDRAYPILGYSLESPATAEIGANIRFWLGQYEQEIAFLASQDGAADPIVADAWKRLLAGEWSDPKSATSVSPILTTTWNQSPYYNNLCPSGTPAGCTAIAMAQVMKYWNYPPQGTGSHSYNHSTYGSLSADFGATTYNWANMPNSLTSSSTSAQKTAVATLCYHVGVSVNMDYGPSGSGAPIVGSNSVQTALPQYFGYKPTTVGIYKSQFTNTAWVDTLKSEISAGRPVVYAGFDNSAGHAFVFDGYNSSSQFHVNWGWGGAYNGYFSIGALNPGGGGTGSNTSNTFNLSNQAVIGIQPMTRLRVSSESVVLKRNGASQQVTVFSNTSNPASWSATADQEWVSLAPAAGSGNGATASLSISASTNASGFDRLATVTIIQDTDTCRIAVGQLPCLAGELCTLKVNMTDRHSDGWEGASLTLSKPSGLVYGTATISGNYGVESFSVCPDTVIVTWNRGSSDNECGFFIDNADGAVWLNHTQGQSIASGVVAVIANPCDTVGAAGSSGPIRFTLSGSPNISEAGIIDGTGSGLTFGSTHTLKAVANDGYRFVRWADNSTINPRRVVVTGNSTYNAVFATIGDDTMRYDNNVYSTALGISGGFYWGVKFAASDFVGRPRVTAVQFYAVYGGAYQITVSEGGASRPTTQLIQGTINVSSSQTGWITASLGDNGIDITPNKPVWITLYAPQVSYPAAMTESWCGSDNSCLISTNGTSWRSLHDSHSRWNSWLVRCIAPIDHSLYTATLSVSDTAAGRVYLTGTDTLAAATGSFRYGERVLCGAVANPGYRFTGWRSEADRNPYAFFIQQDMTDEALFVADPAGICGPGEGEVVTAAVAGRSLTIGGAEGKPVGVFDIMGRLLYSASRYDGRAIVLPAAGIYMIKAADHPALRVAAY